MRFPVKQGTTNVPSPFQGLKMLFTFKRDQKMQKFSILGQKCKICENEGSS